MSDQTNALIVDDDADILSTCQVLPMGAGVADWSIDARWYEVFGTEVGS